jgi:hypothetical protein
MAAFVMGMINSARAANIVLNFIIVFSWFPGTADQKVSDTASFIEKMDE